MQFERSLQKMKSRGYKKVAFVWLSWPWHDKDMEAGSLLSRAWRHKQD